MDKDDEQNLQVPWTYQSNVENHVDQPRHDRTFRDLASIPNVSIDRVAVESVAEQQSNSKQKGRNSIPKGVFLHPRASIVVKNKKRWVYNKWARNGQVHSQQLYSSLVVCYTSWKVWLAVWLIFFHCQTLWLVVDILTFICPLQLSLSYSSFMTYRALTLVERCGRPISFFFCSVAKCSNGPTFSFFQETH